MGQIVGTGDQFADRPLDEIDSSGLDDIAQEHGFEHLGEIGQVHMPEGTILAIFGALEHDANGQPMLKTEIQIAIMDLHEQLTVATMLFSDLADFLSAKKAEHDTLFPDHPKAGVSK